MKEILYQIFSNNGTLSSSRVGHFIGLISVIIMTTFDTIINKRLDFALAGLILTASTGGYAIHRKTAKDTTQVGQDVSGN